MTAAEIVALLDLAPHPEGGWYRQTFRDTAGPEGRGASTAIYFLLEAGQESRWHRVDAAEVPHGQPLAIAQRRPELVITDLAMEPFDGFHLIRTLRGSRDLQDTRILVVTGLSDDEIAARGGLDEATLCYAKPLSFQRLHGYIDALVQRRSAA